MLSLSLATNFALEIGQSIGCGSASLSGEPCRDLPDKRGDHDAANSGDNTALPWSGRPADHACFSSALVLCI